MLGRISLISLLAAALLPIAAYADTGHAGFPAGSIWLSTTAPLSGQETTVYAVVYNSTATKLDGTLAFTVDTKALSTMAISLAAGASQIYSTKWTASEGTHSFGAQLSGTTVSDVAKDAGTVSITVAAPPAPSAAQQAVAQTTHAVSSIASTSLPIISKVEQAVYSTTEKWREQGLALAQKNAASTGSIESGSVLGTSTKRSFPTLGTQKTTGIMAKFYSALVVIFASRAIFYPFFLILILFILWLLMRWVNKPRF